MAQTNLTGKVVLGYTVGEKLGAGAFGTVYKAVKSNLAGQYVRALKHITLPSEKQYYSVLNSMGGDAAKTDSYFQSMLRDILSEVRILNELSERGVPHIVRYYENDIQELSDPRRYEVYILMEYLCPLDEYMMRHPLTVREVVRLGKELLSGLQACHENNVMHRDVKDENIFVTDRCEFKLGDFGVSKVLKDGSRAASMKGTPNFLAPEVYLGREQYSRSVDLYSLGIVLYRLLNYGRNPFLPPFPEQFFAEDEDRAFEERMSGKQPPLPVLGGEALGRVVVKAIAGSAQRYQTAEEFLLALEKAAASTPRQVLEQSVKIGAAPAQKLAETLGETGGFSRHSTMREEDAGRRAMHAQLFRSVGEPAAAPPTEAPKPAARQTEAPKPDERRDISLRMPAPPAALPNVRELEALLQDEDAKVVLDECTLNFVLKCAACGLPVRFWMGSVASVLQKKDTDLVQRPVEAFWEAWAEDARAYPAHRDGVDEVLQWLREDALRCPREVERILTAFADCGKVVPVQEVQHCRMGRFRVAGRNYVKLNTLAHTDGVLYTVAMEEREDGVLPDVRVFRWRDRRIELLPPQQLREVLRDYAVRCRLLYPIVPCAAEDLRERILENTNREQERELAECRSLYRQLCAIRTADTLPDGFYTERRGLLGGRSPERFALSMEQGVCGEAWHLRQFLRRNGLPEGLCFLCCIEETDPLAMLMDEVQFERYYLLAAELCDADRIRVRSPFVLKMELREEKHPETGDTIRVLHGLETLGAQACRELALDRPSVWERFALQYALCRSQGCAE